MIGELLRRGQRTVAWTLQEAHMRRLGIRTTMRLAHLYNRALYGACDARYRRLYEAGYDALLEENGAGGASRARELVDGWHLDGTMTLPHLDRLLAAGDEVIAERAKGRHVPPGTYRAFFQDILEPGDLTRFPAMLDFITSSAVLGPVGRYLRTVPVLSTTLPPGVRFVESWAGHAPGSLGRYQDSQLFHIDYYSRPNVYVIVALRDVTLESGPFAFIPAAESRRVARALGYWGRGVPYRLADEAVFSVAPRSAVRTLTVPRGTVLFIDPSACLHFGSRDAVEPRYLLMVGFTRACRTDWSEHFLEPKRYPVSARDPRLRRLVLERNAAAS